VLCQTNESGSLIGICILYRRDPLCFLQSVFCWQAFGHLHFITHPAFLLFALTLGRPLSVRIMGITDHSGSMFFIPPSAALRRVEAHRRVGDVCAASRMRLPFEDKVKKPGALLLTDDAAWYLCISAGTSGGFAVQSNHLYCGYSARIPKVVLPIETYRFDPRTRCQCIRTWANWFLSVRREVRQQILRGSNRFWSLAHSCDRIQSKCRRAFVDKTPRRLRL
jgi:hypothetical protein